MQRRRWSSLLAGSALVLSGLTVGQVAAQPVPVESRAQAATTTRLTLTASADEADYGTTVVLSGRLTSAGRPLKRQKVVIRHRPGASRTYATVATATTNRKGKWRRAVTARTSGDWIATFRGSRTLAPSKAAKRRVDVFAPLTGFAVSPGNRDAYLDEPWTFVARTAPELAGQTVSLRRGTTRVSTTARTATIGPGGAIAVTHPMSVAGQQEFWLSVDSSALMYGADSPHYSIRTRSETAPTITTTALPATDVHVAYQARLDGAVGGLRWSAPGGLPPGLELSADGMLSGTPSQAGSWEVDVRATNAAGSATRTVPLTVTPGSLTVTTWPLEDGAVGVGYPEGSFLSFGEQAMTCTPCEEEPVWSITAGALPPGLEMAFDEDLLEETYISGTPSQAGVYTFTATAVLGGRSGSRQFTIRVLPSADQLLRIDYNRGNERVPNGAVGGPYTHSFTAGGATGLQWSALSSLPPGLSLSPQGVLSGTPTNAGSGWIYVAVTDGTRYDWQGFAMTVTSATGRAS